MILYRHPEYSLPASFHPPPHHIFSSLTGIPNYLGSIRPGQERRCRAGAILFPTFPLVEAIDPPSYSACQPLHCTALHCTALSGSACHPNPDNRPGAAEPRRMEQKTRCQKQITCDATRPLHVSFNLEHLMWLSAYNHQIMYMFVSKQDQRAGTA
jgi:hypothetical protein